MTSWRNIDDIERDLFEYSDLNYDENFKPAPPKSIAEYRARTTQGRSPGLFDEISEEPDRVFIAGRGIYNGSGNERIIRPGKIGDHQNNDAILLKRIREVSGISYRNEVIEQSLGKTFVDKKEEKCSPASNSSPSSSHSSPKREIEVDEIDMIKLSLVEEKKANASVSPKKSPQKKKDEDDKSKVVEGKKKKKKKFIAFESSAFEDSSSADNDSWWSKGKGITRC